MTSGDSLIVAGNKVDYKSGQKEPFELTIKPYALPKVFEKGILTSGITAPANYILYKAPAQAPTDGSFDTLPMHKN